MEVLAAKLLRLLDKPATEAADKAVAILDGEVAADSAVAQAALDILSRTPPDQLLAVAEGYRSHPVFGVYLAPLLVPERRQWLVEVIVEVQKLLSEDDGEDSPQPGP